jgi:KUP system potassium uptake protein
MNTAHTSDHHLPGKQALHALALAALGIVFGDIGTSPLYSMKESLGEHYQLAHDLPTIMGILSLLVWSLILVVSVKYVTFIMRADNNGEGGILALMALTLRGKEGNPNYRWVLLVGMLGASMFYGDSVITPAVSILSAVEGLNVVSPKLQEYVLPIAIGIIIGLFAMQKHGTSLIGKFFGPICAMWFLSLAGFGFMQIIQHPEIFKALSPHYAVEFFINNQGKAFLVMGSVFLAVTGGEALYADMGHFGRKPIVLAWYGLVLPSLLINYFGQGAYLLGNPDGAANPFFMMLPQWALMPMVLMATAATIIASQAVISGAFSLTSAAIQLGYCPRLKIVHTNASERGQIYVPFVNWVLCGLVLFSVLFFKTSSNLASAYGIAVTTTMLIDDVLLLVVMLTIWKWSKPVAFTVFAALVFLDASFWVANLAKFVDGGWFPALLGLTVFTLLMTWKRGKTLVHQRTDGVNLPLEPFIQSLLAYPPQRVEGTAVFMNSDLSMVPSSLLHNLKHNRVLHERVVFLSLRTEDIPFVAENEKLDIKEIGKDIYVVHGFYGFKEEPSLDDIMARCAKHGLKLEVMDTSFFINRETVIPSNLPGMALWREKLFALMMRNSVRVTDHFKIPANRVVEMGTQIEI